MKFKVPLVKGQLIKRYNRFLCDVQLASGDVVTAHLPNPGAIQGVDAVGTLVWLSLSQNPTRKLAYTWEMAELSTGFVGVNTQHPNFLVEEAIQQKKIPDFKDVKLLKREVKYGRNSRVDFLLERITGELAYIEVKNVHLKRECRAAFPSSITARGAKHMQELADIVQAGHQAYILYVVQRSDCQEFELAHDIDPRYGQATLRAIEQGVKPLVYACDITPNGIEITHSLPFKF